MVDGRGLSENEFRWHLLNCGMLPLGRIHFLCFFPKEDIKTCILIIATC